jgi:MbtH protein
MEMWSVENEENIVFTVLVNDKEQYSLWPEPTPVPNGWRSTGKVGTKAECLEYVNEVWTAMARPSRKQ